jgi:hypothetical protein
VLLTRAPNTTRADAYAPQMLPRCHFRNFL